MENHSRRPDDKSHYFFMSGRYLLGFDVGSSSVKASLVDAETGACAASAFFPESEAPIKAVKVGWAEQDQIGRAHV